MTDVKFRHHYYTAFSSVISVLTPLNNIYNFSPLATTHGGRMTGYVPTNVEIKPTTW